MPPGWLIALPTVVAALAGLPLVRLLYRRRRVPGALPLAAVTCLVIVWCLAYSAVLVVPQLRVKVALLTAEYVAVCTVPPLWLVMVLEVVAAARRWYSRRLVVAALGAPALAGAALSVTNDAHHLVWRATRPVRVGDAITVVVDPGPAFWGVIGFAYACVAIGAAILVGTVVIGSPMLRRQATRVIAGSLMPIGVNALFLARLTPFSDYDPTAVATLIAVAVWTDGLLTARLTTLAPLIRDRVFSAMGDAVIVVDAQDRIVDLNPAASRLLGAASATRDVRIAALLPPDAWRRVLSAAPHPVELEVSSGGEPRTFEARVEPMAGARGPLLGRLLLLREVTASVRAMDARIRLTRMEASTAMAAGIAYRIEALLQTIRGHAQAIATADPAAAAHLAGIVATTQVGDALVDQMLRCSRDVLVAHHPLHLGSLVGRVVSEERGHLPPGVTLSYTVGPDRLEILGDERGLEELVAALLRNAREAIEDAGAITVSVDRHDLGSGGEVEGGVRLPPGPHVRLAVRDDGVGMSPETAARMFEPFFSTKGVGRGLELAVAHGTVLGHRGDIAVATAPGAGTTVAVYLPAITPRGRIRDVGVPRSGAAGAASPAGSPAPG